MARRLLIGWLGGAIAAFMALPVSATPPLSNVQSREYINGVDANGCWDIPGGQRCINVTAWENYDVKGTFQYTEAAINTSFYRLNDDGSWVQSSRYLGCPVDPNAISVLPHGASLEVTLDPAMPGCYSDGQRLTCDAEGNCNVEPWGFPGVVEISGDWIDPMNYASSAYLFRNSFHDGWTNTSGTVVQQCREDHGDAMQDGGFYLNNVFYAFAGLAGPFNSAFHTMRCNAMEK